MENIFVVSFTDKYNKRKTFYYIIDKGGKKNVHCASNSWTFYFSD